MALLALVKHPLLRLGGPRIERRLAAETLELVAFRGGTGRASVLDLPAFFDRRLAESADQSWRPAWHDTTTPERIATARGLCESLSQALAPLAAFASVSRRTNVAEIARATVEALENLARDETGSVAGFYSGERGEAFAAFLRGLVAELGLAVIIVTHDLAVARLLSHRIMVMRHGRVIETGLTDQVLDDPSEAYTQLLVSSVLAA